MPINSTPEETAGELGSSAATADRLRRTELDRLAPALDAERTSLEAERRRLEAKYGGDAAQTRAIARRLELIAAGRVAIDADLIRQRVGTLETYPDAFAMYGRVLTEAGESLSGTTVLAIDSTGANLAEAETDTLGMFRMRVATRRQPDAARLRQAAPSPTPGPPTFTLRVVVRTKNLSFDDDEAFELVGDRAAYREIIVPDSGSAAPGTGGPGRGPLDRTSDPSRRQGAVQPDRLTRLLLWIDSETGITGTTDGPIDGIANRIGAEGGGDGSYPSGVTYRGLNRAGAEYGDDWDGWTGQAYHTFPTSAALADELAFYGSKGFNILRLPISWERVQHELNGELDAVYTNHVLSFVKQANAAGFPVVIDLHNYNRYATGAFDAAGVQVDGYTKHVLGDGTLMTSHLADVWTRIATLFPGNSKVIFNIMNEPHDFSMTSEVWFSSIQTVMNAIRATGATQLILVPNSRGSDVDHWDTWAPNGGSFDSVAALAITDSANNYAFDMHAYQGPPSSPTSYVDLITPITNWARTHGKRLFLSEFGVENADPNGGAALASLFAYLNDKNDVWIGWTAWNLATWNITANGNYAADGPQMPWYAPYVTPNILTSRSVNLTATGSSRPAWRTQAGSGLPHGFRNGTKHSIGFEGTPNYLNAASVFRLNSGSSYWAVVKVLSNNTGAQTTSNPPMTLFGDPGADAASEVGFSAGMPSYHYKKNGVWMTYNSSITGLNDGLVHTVCWTHDVSGTVKCYTDGNLRDTFASVTYDTANTKVGLLGAGYNHDDPFRGSMAEAMVFNSVLTDQNVSDLHSRAVGLWG